MTATELGLRLSEVPKGTHEQWLARRRGYIGASEAAALFGEHPFVGLGDVAVAKRDGIDQGDNRAMARGRRLEATVADWFADEYGLALVEPDCMFVASPVGAELGILSATLDRRVEGEAIGVEVKTTALYVAEVERHWWWQAQTQMLCAGLHVVYFAVLDATLDLKSFEVRPDHEAQRSLVDRAVDFWAHVRRGEIPPDAPMSPATVTRLYPDPQRRAIELDPVRGSDYVRKLALARRRLKELEADERALKAQIAYELGDATDGMLDGRVVVTARRERRESIDTKRLRADHPGIVAEYTSLGDPFVKVLLK